MKKIAIFGILVLLVGCSESTSMAYLACEHPEREPMYQVELEFDNEKVIDGQLTVYFHDGELTRLEDGSKLELRFHDSGAWSTNDTCLVFYSGPRTSGGVFVFIDRITLKTFRGAHRYDDSCGLGEVGNKYTYLNCEVIDRKRYVSRETMLRSVSDNKKRKLEEEKQRETQERLDRRQL